MEFVNGKDDIPYMKWKIKHVWNHQSVMIHRGKSWTTVTSQSFPTIFHCFFLRRWSQCGPYVWPVWKKCFSIVYNSVHLNHLNSLEFFHISLSISLATSCDLLCHSIPCVKGVLAANFHSTTVHGLSGALPNKIMCFTNARRIVIDTAYS